MFKRKSWILEKGADGSDSSDSDDHSESGSHNTDDRSGNLF